MTTALHLDDALVLRGDWTFDLFDGDAPGAVLVERHEQTNRIVTTGKALAMDRLFALGAAPALAGIALGTSATAAADGDTALTGAVYKAFDALPTRSGLVVTCATTFGTGEANIAIREAGIQTASGGVLFNRIAPTASIDKTSALSLRVTVQITQQ